MSMIKSPLGFLYMGLECAVADTPHPCQAGFGNAPETLDAVDVRPAVGEHIVGVFDAIMPLVTDIDQPVVSLPLVGENHGVVRDKAFYYRHERGGGAVFHDLREHAAAAFFHAEDYGLAQRSAPPFALDAARAEVRFVHLHLAGGEGRFPGRHLADSRPREGENTVDGVAAKTRERGNLNPAQVKRKVSEQRPKLDLGNMCVAHILVSHR